MPDAASTLACSPLTPHRERFLFALSASGLLERPALACSPTRGERECLVALDMAFRRRDAFQHPGFATVSPRPSRRAFGPPQDEGMARRKAQILMARVSGEDTRAPLGAP